MRKVDRDLDRILTLLRNRIRERGFNQLEVQKVLGWGRSYISQLLTRQKCLRIEQVLLILKVIDVDPAEFWGEIYQFDQLGERRPTESRRHRAAPSPFPEGDDVESDLRRIRLLYDGVVHVLTHKKVITAAALEAAIARVAKQKE